MLASIAVTALLLVAGCQTTGETGLGIETQRHGASAQTDELIAEFTGRAAARTRTPRQLAAAYVEVINSLVPGMGARNPTDREQPQKTLERIVMRATRPGADAERAALATAMAARLGSRTPRSARVWLLRQLERCGGEESVGALARLLGDRDAEIRECARRALQMNPAPAASATLRQALARAGESGWRVALINALAARRDEQTTDMLAKLAEGDDHTVASAAITALGEIGDSQAVRWLNGFILVADASFGERFGERLVTVILRRADRWIDDGQPDRAAYAWVLLQGATVPAVRIAVLRGLALTRGAAALPALVNVMKDPDDPLRVIAGAVMTELAGENVTEKLADLLPSTPPEVGARLLEGLAARGGDAARGAAMRALESGEPQVRTAAARSLAALGDETAILPLARMAAASNGKEREAARWSLSRLRGDGLDARILGALPLAEPSVRAELVRSVGARHYQAGVTALFSAATDADEDVRVAALEALGTLAKPAELPNLVRRLAEERGETARQAAEDAVVAVTSRIDTPTERAGPVLDLLPQTSGAGKAALIRALGRIGGEDALAAIRSARACDQAEVADAAVRALADWPDVVVLDDLLAIAENGGDDAQRALAVRGYVRLLKLTSECTPAQMLTMLDRVASLARQSEDRKLILSALADVCDCGAVQRERAYLTDDELRDEAASALVATGRCLAAEYPDHALAAIYQARAETASDAVRKQADDALAMIRRHAGSVATWMISGPYFQEGRKAAEIFDVAFAPESADGAEVEWRPCRCADKLAPVDPWIFDLTQLDKGTERCIYARAILWSERRQPAQLEIGSDDGVKVWLNGEVVDAKNVARGVQVGEDKAPVTLAEGRNVLMLKITQGNGGWGFTCGVRASGGGEIEGVRFTAE